MEETTSTVRQLRPLDSAEKAEIGSGKIDMGDDNIGRQGSKSITAVVQIKVVPPLALGTSCLYRHTHPGSQGISTSILSRQSFLFPKQPSKCSQWSSNSQPPRGNYNRGGYGLLPDAEDSPRGLTAAVTIPNVSYWIEQLGLLISIVKECGPLVFIYKPAV